jgi:murein DD-endopeptidase MepM/ murein hydrolase activator NlpD
MLKDILQNKKSIKSETLPFSGKGHFKVGIRLMKYLKFLLSIILTCIFFTIGYSQQDKEKKKRLVDFLNIKAPAINYVVTDTVVQHLEGIKNIIQNKKVEYYFDPSRRDIAITQEGDTNNIDPNDFSIVEIDEEFNIDEHDSLWVKIAEYYGIWDNKSVNPYGIDISKFKDTVSLVLFDSTQNRHWHPPVHDTYLTDDFGPRRYRWHYGVDLELDTGDSVFAVWDGIVRICKYDYGGYGNYIVIRHFNGLETIYGHLSKQLVEVGEKVSAGDLIGWGGSTGRSSGPHLHFEIRYQGAAFNPEVLFDFKNNKILYRVFDLKPHHYNYLKQWRRVYFHKVRRGDTISGIADKYNVTIRQILKLNRISSRTMLKIGRRIRIR